MKDLTLYLFRHGDTPWSPERRLAGQRSDLPLVERGEENARLLGARIRDIPFARVLVSPLTRARRTAELAGFGARAQIEPRLKEMDFGRYEGLTVLDVRRERPGWTYLQGCPEGEGPADLGARADALLTDLEGVSGNVALFAHSVILRVLTARFLSMPPECGRNFMFSPGALCILTFDPVEDARAIAAWNDCAHLLA